jgi:hypothetical protein
LNVVTNASHLSDFFRKIGALCQQDELDSPHGLEIDNLKVIGSVVDRSSVVISIGQMTISRLSGHLTPKSAKIRAPNNAQCRERLQMAFLYSRIIESPERAGIYF